MEDIHDYTFAIVTHYAQSTHRLLFLDYDGTLAPLETHPDLAAPTPALTELLDALAHDTGNQVFVISGRDRQTLESWLGHLPLTLVAEHGGFYKAPDAPWQAVFPQSINAWKERLHPSLHTLVKRYEGSFIEEKFFSLVWHYRGIASRVSPADRKQILAAIRSIPAHDEFEVYDEEYTLELRTKGITKGEFASRCMWQNQPCDFILAIGDGQTDEDLFETIGKSYYTIKVGTAQQSAARFSIATQESVPHFLRALIRPSRLEN